VAFVPASWRVRLILLVVVVAGLAVSGGYWAVAAAARSAQAAPFKPHLSEYLAAPAGPGPMRPLHGKIVVVDRKTQDIDWDVFFGLPDPLRAARPEEVGTVVQLEYGREKGPGVYGKDRWPSFFQTCQVTVLDAADRRVIGTTTVRGGDPPSEISDSQREGVGPPPTAPIIDYLKGLPRQ
jgi:hypothetical protein